MNKIIIATRHILQLPPELQSKINITTEDIISSNNDNYLPLTDEYPTNKLKRWQKQTILNLLTECDPSIDNVMNAVFDLISGTYLEYCQLLKIDQRKT